ASLLSKQWQKDKVLIRDKNISFYLCKESFDDPKILHAQSKKITRYGLIALVAVGDHIIPHEKTFQKYVEDRAQVTLHTDLQLECVFSMFENKSVSLKALWVESDKQRIQFKKDSYELLMNEIHDSQIIHHICEKLQENKIYIIDGHHRFAALNYYHEKKKSKDKYVMMYLTNLCDEGLCVLSTHRAVVWKNNIDASQLLSNSGLRFETYPWETGLRKIQSSSCLIGLSSKSNPAMIKVFDASDCALQSPKHLRLIDKLLQDNPSQVDYVRGLFDYERSLVQEIQNQKYDSVFWVSPVSWNEFFDVTDHRTVMPQKSTYFYPKILSGTVIYPLWQE
ncbi:MAG: DUF1015 family protein, partial [Deltaproteobacteria bacterium]|nr:DUF1015 family protein [Deltaproteobacteria bacterium]